MYELKTALLVCQATKVRCRQEHVGIDGLLIQCAEDDQVNRRRGTDLRMPIGVSGAQLE